MPNAAGFIILGMLSLFFSSSPGRIEATRLIPEEEETALSSRLDKDNSSIVAEEATPAATSNSTLTAEETTIGTASASSSSRVCVGCAERKRIEEATLSEIELRQAKIELIKYQILSRLGLREPPQLRASRMVLPDVLAHGEAFTDHQASKLDSQNAYNENEQSTETTNVVIFPENGTVVRQCSRDNVASSSSSICFTFRVSPQQLKGTVTNAEIWLYKTSSLPTNQSLVMSEIVHEGTFARRKRILAFESDPPGTGWLKFNLGVPVRRWLTKPHLNHSVEITCKGCSGGPLPLSSEERHQPFLVVTTRPSIINRRRRSADCTNSSTDCCREHFHVSFKEIGWDNWIFQPSGYTANYCRGSCISDVSISRYFHTTVLVKYLQSQSQRNDEPKITLCCTPSKLSSLSLIYMDESNMIIQSKLANMVAEACDCA